MANSKLINRNIYYKIPQYIIDNISINIIKNKQIKSTKKQKVKNFIKNPFLSYESIKRLKNIMETLGKKTDDNTSELIEVKKNDYFLLGGLKMYNWLNQILDSLRTPIHRSKQVKSAFAGLENEFKTNHSKSFNKAPKLPKIQNIAKDLKPKLMQEDIEIPFPIPMKYASICLLFNSENKLLLLKRSATDKWMPEKYSLVGGVCNENESPEKCVIREIKEETSLIVNKCKFLFTVIEQETFVYVFIGKTDNEEIKLDAENTEAIWVDYDEVSNLDTVPNLTEIIEKATILIKK